MLQLPKGSTVPFPERLFEQYEVTDPHRVIANVGADKQKTLLDAFIDAHDEPLFFVLELPTNRKDEPVNAEDCVTALHRDVYYIDGCTAEQAHDILNEAGELLIQDGLCAFGFGGHFSKDELFIGKYAVASLYGDTAASEALLEQCGIAKTVYLVTAWDTFTADAVGESRAVEQNGETVFSLPERFRARGMYFAQRRED